MGHPHEITNVDKAPRRPQLDKLAGANPSTLSKGKLRGVAGDSPSPGRSRYAGTPAKKNQTVGGPIFPVIRGLPPIGRP